MFTDLRDTAIFIEEGKRRIEALRIFERERCDFENKVSDFKEKYKLVEKPWKIEFDNLNSFEEFGFKCKSYAVMFSGGFDSLSLALRHLENKERVYLLSVGFSPAERQSAWLSAQILKSLYGKNNVKFIRLFNNIFVDGEGTSGLTQQPFCAFYASFMPELVCKNIKAVECAYVQNDTAISYLQEISKIYAYAMKCHFAGKNFPPMKFPLIKVEHWENIKYIKQIEEKYNVMFPALSAEFIKSEALYSSEHGTAYILKAEENSANSNKACDVCGYIFLEHNDTNSLEQLYFIKEEKDE